MNGVSPALFSMSRRAPLDRRHSIVLRIAVGVGGRTIFSSVSTPFGCFGRTRKKEEKWGGRRMDGCVNYRFEW
jgi:hypothetical protein